jgi:hypothetical protein
MVNIYISGEGRQVPSAISRLTGDDLSGWKHMPMARILLIN